MWQTCSSAEMKSTIILLNINMCIFKVHILLNYLLNSPKTCLTDCRHAKDIRGLGFHGPIVDHEPTAAQHCLTLGNKPVWTRTEKGAMARQINSFLLHMNNIWWSQFLIITRQNPKMSYILIYCKFECC